MESTLIDNSSEILSMAKYLNCCLMEEGLKHVRIATGYWDMPGTALLIENLKPFLAKDGTSLQLLLGKDPYVYANELAKLPEGNIKPKYPEAFIKKNLNDLEFNEENKCLIEYLINQCDGDNPKIEIRLYKADQDEPATLHAKCYIFNGVNELERPWAYGIIGSSNFTRKGLAYQENANSELNYLETNSKIVDYEDKDEKHLNKGHIQWFDEKWKTSEPWNKDFLLKVVGESQFKPLIDEHEKGKEEQSQEIVPLTPYELYIKLLQTKFGDLVDKNLGQQIENYLPNNQEKNIHYDTYNYQIDAVKQCYNTMREYGGFLLADVVGLGKTVVGTLLIRHFIETPDEEGRERKILIVTPPAIRSAWENTIADFDSCSELKINDYVDFITTGSIGKLVDDLKPEDMDNVPLDSGHFEDALKYNSYGLIIVDESHKFRNADTTMYKSLDQLIAQIGSETGNYPYIGLLSATPQNNRPADLKNQIYLFTRNRTSSKLKKAKGGNVESYFADIEETFQSLIRKPKNKVDSGQFKEEVELSSAQRHAKLKKISESLRCDILDYIMVRRTRTDVSLYYQDDMRRRRMTFPTIKGPNPLRYKMSDPLAELFADTMNSVSSFDSSSFTGTDGIGYYRYRAIQFLKNTENKDKYNGKGSRDADSLAIQLARIMQLLLVKRLESSFSAFQQSLDNLKHYTYNMIKMWEKNQIFICPQLNVNEELDFKKKTAKRGKKVTFDDCLCDVRTKLKRLNDEGRNEDGSNAEYTCEDFDPNYIDLLKADYEVISELCERWGKNSEDPKLDEFKDALRNELFNTETNPPQKLVIFTEAIDTAETIVKAAEANGFKDRVLLIKADNRDKAENLIKENFDANYKGEWSDKYQIIVTTDVLAEGINLHRANVILNYDTPWNSTKLMQRIGRVNRIGSKEKEVHVFNFLPSANGDKYIDLVNKAYTKLQSFHTVFGEDSKVFTEDEEVEHYDLNTQVNGDESPMQKYIYELKEYRDSNLKRYNEILSATDNLQQAIVSGDGTGLFVVKTPRATDFYVAVNPNDEEGTILSLPDMLERFKSNTEPQSAELPIAWEDMSKEAVRMVIAELASVRQRQGNSARATNAKGAIKELKRSQAMSAETKKLLNLADTLIRLGNPDMVNCILVMDEAVKKQNMLMPYTQEDFDNYINKHIAKLVQNVQLRNGKPEVFMAIYK